MRNTLLLALLLLSAQAFGIIRSVRIDTSSTNIPASYTTASTSKVLASGVRTVDAIFIDNRTAGEIAVNCSGNATTAPDNSSTENIYVNAATAWAVDNARIGNVCYVRSMTGSAISSGIVTITVNGY